MRRFIQSFLMFLARLFLSVRYRVSVTGELPDSGKPLVIMPKHPAFVDPLIVFAWLIRGRRIRPVVDQGQMKGIAGRIIALADPVVVPDVSTDPDGVRNAVVEAGNAVGKGQSILIYPTGRLLPGPTDTVNGRTGAFDIVKSSDCTPVCVSTAGLWGSRFSRCGISRKGIAWKGFAGFILSLGFLFPKRNVEMEVVPCPGLAGETDKERFDMVVDSLIGKLEEPSSVIPLVWWKKPEPVRLAKVVRHADKAMVESVIEVLSETFDGVTGDTDLARDLGLDSLGIVELACEVEKRTGVPAGDVFGVRTPFDLAGVMGNGSVFSVPDEWGIPVPIANMDERMAPDDTDQETGYPLSVLHRFAACVKKNPSSPLVLDNGTLFSRRKLAGLAHMVGSGLGTVDEDVVGIMLPAGIAATASFLGAHAAGKTPVMVNFTTGMKPLEASLALAGCRHVITAKRFLDKWDGELPKDVAPILLEDVLDMPFRKKALFLARTFLPRCGFKACGDRAAILFTSGSEGTPKGVPLTHENILADTLAVDRLLSICGDDRFLGMLPPFHSLGLLSTVILPCCVGVKTVYRPNPADGGDLARTAEATGTTLLCATPTFLAAMLETGRDLSKIRMAFVGAEKCPDRTFKAFDAACPEGTICEGYGVTECSPVVSANRPGLVVRGTIGEPVDCCRVMIADDDGRMLPSGIRGRLLVRGDNVFDGYLGRDPMDGFVLVDGEKWYDTGDLAMWDRATPSHMVFLGRTKRFMKIAGEMISLPAMEEAITPALPRTQDDEGHPLFAVVEHDGKAILAWAGNEDLEIDILNRRIVAFGLSPLHKIANIVHLETIPVLGTGKTDFPGLDRMIK